MKATIDYINERQRDGYDSRGENEKTPDATFTILLIVLGVLAVLIYFVR